MKEFTDKYGNDGFKTNDGTLRVTKHFDNKQLKYVRLENHNGKTVAIRIDKVKEIIEMLESTI